MNNFRKHLMKKSFGFTLIEIMISLALGLIIMAATLNMYIGTIKGTSDIVKSARLNYDMEMAMQFMVNDIRRAGSWGGAITGSNATLNSFTQDITNMNIMAADGTAGGNTCIVYAYDADLRNGDNEDPANPGLDMGGDAIVGTGELYGFKFESNTIKVRHSVTGLTTPGSPTAAELKCDNGNWKNILDSDNIEITALTFTTDGSDCYNKATSTKYDQACAATIADGNLTTGQAAVETREIRITMSGVVKGDVDVKKDLVSAVKVRTDRIFIKD